MAQGIILAAGFGSRLGHDKPKALIPWHDGCIIDQQINNLRASGIQDITVVTGFQADEVEAHVNAGHKDIQFVRNDKYMDTNTAKSLLCALQVVPAGRFVMMNGDVVFDKDILDLITKDEKVTTLAVDPRVCGDEEVKYRIREDRLMALSKVVHGEGESVGINHFAASDRPLLEKALAYVEAQAYFERAVEHMLPYTQNPVQCAVIGDLRAMEIDFPEDLEAARKLFA